MEHTRIFDGKKYKNIIVVRKKSDARRVAKRYRVKGYSARVLKSGGARMKNGIWYGVYVPMSAPGYKALGKG